MRGRGRVSVESKTHSCDLDTQLPRLSAPTKAAAAGRTAANQSLVVRAGGRDALACSNASPKFLSPPPPRCITPDGHSPAPDASALRTHRDAMALLTEKALVNYEEQEGA